MDGEPPESVVIVLSVEEPPSEEDVDSENDGGPNLVLPCSTTGTPPPLVTWFRKQAAIDAIPGDTSPQSMATQIDPEYVDANGTLAIDIRNETEAARNGIVYFCVASNWIGPDNSILAALRSRDVRVSHSCECKGCDI